MPCQKTMISVFFVVVLCVFLPWQSHADTRQRQEILSPLFDMPCDKYGVPKNLAMAVARQESDMNPWVINVSGRDFYMKNREEALALAQAAYRAGRSFDVGIMQINTYWIKEYKLPLEVVVDPQNNVQIGVWILAKMIRQYGLNWKAVAYYHTPLHRHPERGRDYATRVLKHLRNILDEK